MFSSSPFIPGISLLAMKEPQSWHAANPFTARKLRGDRGLCPGDSLEGEEWCTEWVALLYVNCKMSSHFTQSFWSACMYAHSIVSRCWFITSVWPSVWGCHEVERANLVPKSLSSEFQIELAHLGSWSPIMREGSPEYLTTCFSSTSANCKAVTSAYIMMKWVYFVSLSTTTRWCPSHSIWVALWWGLEICPQMACSEFPRAAGTWLWPLCHAYFSGKGCKCAHIPLHCYSFWASRNILMSQRVCSHPAWALLWASSCIDWRISFLLVLGMHGLNWLSASLK